jgi:hypothetical protein
MVFQIPPGGLIRMVMPGGQFSSHSYIGQRIVTGLRGIGACSPMLRFSIGGDEVM